MTKNYAILMTAALAFATPAAAAGPPVAHDDEVARAPGSLAYAAMVDEKYDAALTQLLQQDDDMRADPAWQINTGQAYAGLGRYEEARTMFVAAINNRHAADLVLADGTVMDSRDVARLALDRLGTRLSANLER